MIDLRDNDHVHRFDHEAMNTLFSLRIDHPDRGLAYRAANACFQRLDRIEGFLSRYRDDSDVSRINALAQGESLFIDDDTYACLQLAVQASAATGGLFDVTLGARIEHRKQDAAGEPPGLRGKVTLSPDRPLITCDEPGRQIDLGGIGKGFALDRMAEILREHDVTSALLSCSGSTLLAFGPKQWPVVLRGDSAQHKLELSNEALSSSGTAFQGAHVVHPDQAEFTYSFPRIWVVAEQAGTADAFSTACLIMNEDELVEFCAAIPELKHCFAESLSQPQLFCFR